MPETDNIPVLLQVEPVLAVTDVPKTVQYWHDVLGFRNQWTWGEPPNHGGVSWQGAFIQFSHNPQLAAASKGNAVFITVRNLERIYDLHKENGAEIVEPPENKPWGMAAYTLRDINDYYVVFAGASLRKIENGNSIVPPVNVVSRLPRPDEYRELVAAVGWEKNQDNLRTETILAAPVYGVVAEDPQGNAIGCALLLSDQASFYYVKDVVVHPQWQRRGVGSRLMKKLSEWLDANAPEGAYIGLFTGENLAAFYKRFDFVPTFGMSRRIFRKKV